MTTIDRLNVVFAAVGGDKVSGEIKRLSGSFSGLTTKSYSLRDAMTGLAGAAGFAYAAKKAFDLGSTVEETGSKFRTVFGQSTADVQAFIDRFGTMAGLSNEQAQSVLATTGSIVQGMGFARDASAAFATEVVKLAGDLSSFNNVPIAETARAVQAALTGEREQLKRLGIVVREVDVQQRALAMTGKTVASALTTQEKATATLQLITERSGVAIGDLARTQDSAANHARRLGAEIQNLKEDFAVALTPALSVAVDWALKFIGGMKLMGVDVAVALAKVRLAWAQSPFGDDESFKAAIDNLHFTSMAAAEMRREILGLGDALGGVAGGGPNLASGTDAAVRSLNIASAGITTMASQLPGITQGVQLFASANIALAGATNAAADAQERLNNTQQKFGAALGALGFLSGLPGLGFLSGPLGLLGGGVSSFFGLQGAFGGGKAVGGPVTAGTSYVVGERGPEMFIPESAGTIVPNGGAGLVFNVGPARDPIAWARDAQWQRAILKTFENLTANGYQPA